MLTPSIHNRQALYTRTLNRMGWSMLIFIGLFNATTGISSSILLMRDYVASPSSYRVLTAIYGLLAALCYAAPFFLTGLIYYAMSRSPPGRRPLNW